MRKKRGRCWGYEQRKKPSTKKGLTPKEYEAAVKKAAKDAKI